MTKVVNINREPCDERCDRSTIWGNIFRIGRDGTRLEVIAKYRAWLPTQPHLMARLHTLKGRTLGCHCKPKPCHVDVIAEFADAT